MEHMNPSASPSWAGTQAKTSNQLGTNLATLPSAALLQGHKAVAISHNGMVYTLQSTKMGKLILTK
jgi:hemin uptake protein HemP